MSSLISLPQSIIVVGLMAIIEKERLKYFLQVGMYWVLRPYDFPIILKYTSDHYTSDDDGNKDYQQQKLQK